MKEFLKKHLSWAVFRPAGIIAVLQSYSWLFSLDPVILGWVIVNKMITVTIIVVFAIGTHLWWDREKQNLQTDYKTILDEISKKIDKIAPSSS